MKRFQFPSALLALTLACTFARAATTTLNFDDVAPGAGVALTNQYAGQGVTFESGIVIGSPTARSAPNVAVGVRANDVSIPYIRGHFAAPYASSVTAWVENNAAEPVYITAFDGNGVRLKEVDAQRTAAPGTYFPLTLSSAVANIATFVVGGMTGGQNVVVDDLSFDRAQAGAGGPWTVSIDVAAGRHAIDPRIYGITWATQAQIADLNAPTNRHGGTPTSSYNWTANADNRGNDYFFESIGYGSAVPGAFTDDFIGTSKAASGEPMMTVPMLGWIAKLGPNRSTLSSYSIAKYGPQTDHDPNTPDFGSGFVKATKAPITTNDPNDAGTPNSVDYERQWLKHMTGKWGVSQAGGVKYYGLDNEPGIWHSSHQDVQPVGVKQDDYLKTALAFAGMIKEEDPKAVVTGPEEWGWSGYFYSGYDQQYGAAHNFQSFPDRAAHGNMEYSAWLLDQFHKAEMNGGKRLLDVFTLHFYPQSGEFTSSGADAIAPKMQLLRNESTRSLWDPNYLDKSWINDKVNLIPRMKQWVNTYYPGTLIGLTEYNWGAEDQINGATAQADVMGILGREGADLANRWTTPDASTPTYKAMKLYRNYDGKKSTFGDVSVSTTGPNPDQTSVFASQRTSDGAMTVMVVNKVTTDTPMTVHLANFVSGGPAQEWQLTSTNAINSLPGVPVNGGTLAVTVPAQSVTLFVVPRAGGPMPDPVVPPIIPPVVPPAPGADPTFTSSVVSHPDTVEPGGAIIVTANVTDTSGNLDSGIVDLELYNAKGERIAQRVWDKQTFVPKDSRNYEYDMTAPVDEGIYTFKIGVFNADWSKNPHWNDGAAILTVKKPVAPVPPAVDPTFTSSAVVTPGTVAPGKSVTISATVTGVTGELANAIVDVEVYNAGGTKVAQKTWMGQNFTPNHTETYAYALTAPAEEGAYVVNVGVFNSDWTKNPHWNNQAAVFTVKSGAIVPAKKGDVNGDGAVDLRDVVAILRVAVGLDPATPALILAGDANGSGSIDIGDAVLLLRQIVGL